MPMIKPQPGTYLLLFTAKEPHTLQVGRLGVIELSQGYYCYIGSAFGPGGIRARVRHHAKISPRPHWHLDYVRPVMSLLEVWYRYEAHSEHRWAKRLSKVMDMPMAGFGASDCRCQSHFFYAAHKPDLANYHTEWAHTCQGIKQDVQYREIQ